MSIRLLGPFEVRIGSELITADRFERPVAAHLVQLLALAPDRRRHRDQIIDALWPEVDLDKARRRLYKATTLARKALLSADAVVVQGESIALFPGQPIWIDVEEFTAADLDDPTAVRAAIDLYGDELLADNPYAEWIQTRRWEAANRHRDLLRAVGDWSTLAQLDPTDESAHVAMMRDDLDAGDRSAALRRYHQLESALATELGTRPGEEAEQLRRTAVQGVPTQQPAQTTGNRVEAHDEIFGRDDTVKSTVEGLQKHRLVTVTGPGGVGKTHLARHAAVEFGADFDSPVWMCELGNLGSANGLLDNVLDSVGGTRHIDAGSLDSTIRLIGDQPALVVLDNCEHLIDAVRDLVGRLLPACPALRILATSREALGSGSELVIGLDTLSRPAATALFVAEVQRQGGTVEPDAEILDRICAQLDDAPLAIVLAAARAGTLGLDGVEKMLDTRLDELRAVGRQTDARHTTLRASIEWSFDALPEPAQHVLADLGAFANRFTLDGVVAVAGARHGGDRSAVLDAFDQLVRQSLVMGPTPGPGGSVSFRLLESVRLFARERTADDVAADAHLDHVLARVAESRQLVRENIDDAMQRIDSDWDDMRRARAHASRIAKDDQLVDLLSDLAPVALPLLRFEYLDWCVDAVGRAPTAFPTPAHARTTAAMAVFLAYRGEIDHCLELTERTLDALPDDEITLFARGWLLGASGRGDLGRSCFEALADDAPGTFGPLRSGGLLALVVIYAGAESVKPLVVRSAALADLGGLYRVNHLAIRAMHQLTQGDVESTLADLDESIQLADAYEHRFSSTAVRDLRAFTALYFGSTADGMSAVRDALRWPQLRGVWTLAVTPLTMTAKALVDDGDPETATMLLAASEHTGLGHRSESARRPLMEHLRASHADFDSWWAAGEVMELRSAIALAVSVLDDKLAAL